MFLYNALIYKGYVKITLNQYRAYRAFLLRFFIIIHCVN
ncbi:hypothetical protein ECDEC8C_6488 [Escherichia coli DEC8C]|nr:hypothetical protein ECDEC8C_6488 [Escherichia coli DEC8C]